MDAYELTDWQRDEVEGIKGRIRAARNPADRIAATNSYPFGWIALGVVALAELRAEGYALSDRGEVL